MAPSPPDFDLSWVSPWLDPKIYALDETGRLPGLEEVLNQSVLRGGKRLRPLLMSRFAALFGVGEKQILPFARAAEQIHSATLAHDDVIDVAEFRRGLRTLNARMENRRAVLGGDYLLADGIFEVARQKNLSVLEDLSETLRELVTGELLQNEARGRTDVSATHLARIADLKTGSLFRWCCGVPARLVESSPEALRLARDFASRTGRAFQWIDDILDYSPDSGKPMGQDLREGLVNRVTHRLLERSPEHFPAVKAMLGSADELRFPWTPAELDTVVAEIRADAAAELALARKALGDLSAELMQSGRPAPADAVAQVESLIRRLEKREK